MGSAKGKCNWLLVMLVANRVWRWWNIKVFRLRTGMRLHISFWRRCDDIGWWKTLMWDCNWKGLNLWEWFTIFDECIAVVFYVI